MRSENEPGGRHGARKESERSFIERARRSQIMEAAAEVIAVRGFARASLAQIAERAGISKGVISYHFAGRSELMEQLVEQIYEQIDVFVRSRMAGRTEWGGSPEWIRLHVRSVAEYMKDHRSQLAALSEIFRNHRTGDGELRYGVVASEPLYEGLERAFRAGQENGAFRDFDTRVMAVSFQAAIDQMFAYWSAYPEHDLEAHAADLAELFVHATRAPDTAPGES